MKWLLLAAIGLVAVVIIITVIGALLPREHTASRSLVIHQAAATVWNAISDFAAAPSWRKDVSRVERGPDRNGHPVWIEHGSNGALPLEVVEASPPSILVTRIADPNLPFGGTWTYRLGEESGSTRLTITEQGWVSNPIFRFVSRVVMGHHATIDAYLKNVTVRFNEPPAPAKP